MSKITLQQAAEMVGITKQAIRKATKGGKLSSEKDAHGRLLVDAGDVQRIWHDKINPPSDPQNANTETEILKIRNEMMEGRLSEAEKTIEDLRSRLDAESQERRKLSERLLLEDQSGRKSKGLFSRLFG